MIVYNPFPAIPLIALSYSFIVFCTCLAIDYTRSLLFGIVNKNDGYIMLLKKIDKKIYDVADCIYNNCNIKVRKP